MRISNVLLVKNLFILGVACSFASAQDIKPILRDAPRPTRFSVEDVQAAGTGLPTWTGSFTHNGKEYRYVMIGSDPAKGSLTSYIPVYLIPLRLKFSDGTVFDASAPMFEQTVSATQAVEQSPIFQDAEFGAAGTSLGKTQYTDAFQRGNFWSYVSTVSPDYHVLLGQPIVLPVQSFTVPASHGSTFPGPFPGAKRAVVDQAFTDKITKKLFAKFRQIDQSTFTIFLTYNVFPGGAYGFHDAYGKSPATARTYTYTSYLSPYKALIDADISTLAHEVGEWMDDAYINNNTPCGILEVGDPLNTSIFGVKLNGMVWHPQDLTYIGYFSFDPSQTVHHWLTFRNTLKRPCENGPAQVP